MLESTDFAGRVPPFVGLALLESLRAADMPADEGELHEVDLPLSLRRRLGLSGVVEKQIKRYAQLRDRRDSLAAEEVARLFQLIGRRDDADAVFAEAGRRMARRDMGRGGLGRALASRTMPRSARQRLALRHARRLARQLSPGARVHAEARPPVLVVESCLPARAVDGRQGCSLLSGAMQSIFERYRVGDLSVVHPSCEGDSAEHCLWRLEEVAAAEA